MRSAPQGFHSPVAAHDIPRSQYFQGLRGICISICSHRIPSNPTAVGVSVGVSPKKGRIVKPIELAQPRAKCTFRFLPLWDSIHQGPDRIRQVIRLAKSYQHFNHSIAQHYHRNTIPQSVMLRHIFRRIQCQNIHLRSNRL